VKRFINRFIRPLFIGRTVYLLLSVVVALSVVAFFFPVFDPIPRLVLFLTGILFLFDYLLLFAGGDKLEGKRVTPERLSNGDENPLSIHLKNKYPFPVVTSSIDEIPFQFQVRNLLFRTAIPAGQEKVIHYSLRPVKRGEYFFGMIRVYVKTRIGLAVKRYHFEKEKMVPVYPSYLQMRRYQLMAISNRLTEMGVRKIRRIGHSMEFEQIKDYVKGDDIRTINWKATARKNQLMVNAYTEEKSQQVFCIIDKSRVMKMPFDGLSLLDYAINATLVLSNVALLRQDKAGLITFSEKPGVFLPASRKATQMNAILELLYSQKTKYLESDFEKLYALTRNRITQRSLLVLFTNFESLYALRRQARYLAGMAQRHLLLVIFFENTELTSLIRQPADDLQAVYTKTIAEKFNFEKKLIVRELQQMGILALLTPPGDLTVNTVNKYLEIKARQAI
jgi:uncharacterized protein (DUF58 family)